MVERYHPTSDSISLIAPHSRGDYVRYSDYAALEAQLAVGWLYFNPDTGTEWAEQHPIESGEVPDAQNVRAATAANLLKELVPAWADLANETKARRSALEATPPAPMVTEALKAALTTMYRYQRTGCGDDVFYDDLSQSIRKVEAALTAAQEAGKP